MFKISQASAWDENKSSVHLKNCSAIIMEFLTDLTPISVSRNYKIRDQGFPHFVTFTTVNWIDIFTRNCYKECLIESLKYCQANKGLILYGYCFMTNHIHLIIGTKKDPMQGIIRDFKAFTSRQIKLSIKENASESRKNWLLWMFTNAGIRNSNNRDWQLWQQSSHPIELSSNFLQDQKLEYIHQNPVKAGFVDKSEDWIWSSARNYMGEQGLIEVEYLS